MNFKQLEAFYWLAKLGSYQKVAKQINITQPAVSIRVKSLETELGAQLIRRDSPNFALTEKGYEVAEYAKEFMLLYERMRQSLVNKRAKPFVIGMTEAIMASWGGDFVTASRALYPQIQQVVHVELGRNLLSAAERGELDLAFGLTTVGMTPTSFRVRFPMSWVAHRDLVVPRDEPLTTSELAALPLVLFPREHALAPANSLATALTDIRAMEHQESMAMSQSSSCEMVRNGMGVAPLVLAVVASDLDSGKVRKIETLEQLPPLYACCLYINSARRKLAQDLYDLAAKTAELWCERHPDYATFFPE
jgi:DNA-binding transcriptional LysR family regulator